MLLLLGLSFLLGVVKDFFSYVKLLVKNGVKLVLRERECNGFVFFEGLLFWNFIRIYDVMIRKGEVIFFL